MDCVYENTHTNTLFVMMAPLRCPIKEKYGPSPTNSVGRGHQIKVDKMSITPDDIQKIALLSRLKVDENKVEKLSGDINNILGLVDQLQQANTDGVAPMAHPLDAVQTLRADQVTETNQREKYQSNAPAVEDGLFLVPKVIE
jgi:aspartyl-tRNA(Asn)/glutamyl-tRNA(Gln) amidotransferase subunit C